MKVIYSLFLMSSFLCAMSVQNDFADKIKDSTKTEKENQKLHESINHELVSNIAIKTNLLKKADENYTRLGIEKNLTAIYMETVKGTTK